MSRTQQELRASAVIAPALAEAAKARPVDIAHPDPLVFRKNRADHLARLRYLMPLGGKAIQEVEEHDVLVRVRDGTDIKVRVYTPVQKLENGGPLILMFHEGGFMYGDLTDEEMNCRLFSRDFGAICGNVEYRLAPEHRFPTWIHDCGDVTQHFALNASAYGANPSKGFIVGGSSAGGSISAVHTQLSRTEGLEPPITGQYLSVPLIFPIDSAPKQYMDEYLSVFENVNDPVLKGVDSKSLSSMIEKLGIDPTSPLYTPIASPHYPPSSSSVKRPMAPAYLQVAGLDPIRDHGLVYNRVLKEEYKTPTKCDLYPGFCHMFWTNFPEVKESYEFVEDTMKGIKWLLEQRSFVLE